jgi:hypothetical protein
MYNYNELVQLINKSRSKNPQVMRNTRVRLETGLVIVKFWDTDIISIDSNNVYTVQVEGFYTKTTKDRLNSILPATVRSVKRIWMIGEFEFFDGIQIGSNGVVLNGVPAIDSKLKMALNKMISKYSKNLISNWDSLSEPSCGDCMFCSGVIPSNDVEHLYAHLSEMYLMQRVFYNALAGSGYTVFAADLYGDAFKIKLVQGYFNKHFNELLKFHVNYSSNKAA